jgi:cell division protein FtsB
VKRTATLATRQTLPIKRSFNAKRIGQLLALFFAAVFAIDGVIGDRGMLALMRTQKQAAKLAIELERQRAINVTLSEQARRLRDDPAAIEEYARHSLGLIRPGEKVFIIRDLASPGHSAEK